MLFSELRLLALKQCSIYFVNLLPLLKKTKSISTPNNLIKEMRNTTTNFALKSYSVLQLVCDSFDFQSLGVFSLLCKHLLSASPIQQLLTKLRWSLHQILLQFLLKLSKFIRSAWDVKLIFRYHKMIFNRSVRAIDSAKCDVKLCSYNY
jgi:hypothetical protein